MWIEIWLGILTVMLILLFMRGLRTRSPGTESSLQGEMESFFQEFERENQEMLQVIARFKQKMTAQLDGQTAQINSLQEKVAALYKETEELKGIIELGKMQVQSSSPPQSRSMHPNQSLSFLRDDYKDIPSLYHKGYSVSEIARKLGMGSGEVEMVVQMLRKNEGNE